MHVSGLMKGVVVDQTDDRSGSSEFTHTTKIDLAVKNAETTAQHHLGGPRGKPRSNRAV